MTGVDTLVEFPTEQLNTHNTEYQPRKQANQENIANTRNGAEQRAYDNLKMLETIYELETIYFTRLLPNDSS